MSGELEAFAQSDNLKGAMQEAGVKGKPAMTFVEDGEWGRD